MVSESCRLGAGPGAGMGPLLLGRAGGAREHTRRDSRARRWRIVVPRAGSPGLFIYRGLPAHNSGVSLSAALRVRRVLGLASSAGLVGGPCRRCDADASHRALMSPLEAGGRNGVWAVSSGPSEASLKARGFRRASQAYFRMISWAGCSGGVAATIRGFVRSWFPCRLSGGPFGLPPRFHSAPHRRTGQALP